MDEDYEAREAEERARIEEEERLAREAALREDEERRQREEEERAREAEEADRARAEEEERERREQEEKENEKRRYIEDKHCAYCTHLIPDKRDGRMFYCDKRYDYVSGTSNACEDYEEAGRSTVISNQIYSDQYGFEADEHDCAFCTHLIPDKKNEGKYYCDKLMAYVKGTDSNKTNQCSYFEVSGRSTLECEMIRDDSEALDSNSGSIISKRFCCDCRFYNTDDKQGEGYYMCTKRGQAMAATQEECYMFETSGRSRGESEKLYDEAVEAQKEAEKPKGDGNSFVLKLVLGIILLAAGIIITLVM